LTTRYRKSREAMPSLIRLSFSAAARGSADEATTSTAFSRYHVTPLTHSPSNASMEDAVKRF